MSQIPQFGHSTMAASYGPARFQSDVDKGLGGITLRETSKVFAGPNQPDQLVLDRVDLDIAPGQVTCLVGPSGCGKTTLLNIIAGFETVTAGSVQVNGLPVTKIGPDRAVVFQQPALFPWMDVLGNVMAAAKAQGESPSKCRPEAMALVQRLGLSGSERLYPYQLSGGMKQRVQIARALLCRPAVLLMDEPFGALDAQTRLSLQELMLELLRTLHPTVVFVTHDVEEATLLGSRVVVMTRNPGRIRECIDVNVPEPRNYLTLADPSFIDIKQRLLTLLHDSNTDTA